MAAPGHLRTKALAGFASLALHAFALGAVFLAVRVSPPAGVAPPAIIAVELIAPPQASPATPRANTRAPRPAEATAPSAPPPAPIATIVSIEEAPPQSLQRPLTQAEQDAYLRAVWRHLAAHRPRASGALRPARITFALEPSGAVRYAVIDRSSGSQSFDAACLRAVQSAAPFPPAPAGTPENLLVFVAPFSTRP